MTDELLRELIAEVRALRQGLVVNGESGGEERLPSIATERMAEGKPWKVVTKSYAGHPLTRSLIDDHFEATAYACMRAEQLAMAGWQATLDTLAVAKNGGAV